MYQYISTISYHISTGGPLQIMLQIPNNSDTVTNDITIRNKVVFLALSKMMLYYLNKIILTLLFSYFIYLINLAKFN